MSWPRLLLAFLIPSAVAWAGFRIVLPALVTRGWPVLVAWPAVASLMLLGLVIFAVFRLGREARKLGITLWARMGMKKLALTEWALYIGLTLIGLGCSFAAMKLVLPFMNALGLNVPAYMPFFLNPAIDPAVADMAVISPGLPLAGKYCLLPLIAITLLLNILAEELYFRAWILPRLSRFGAWSWMLNGVLFAFYHTFQIWLLPTLLMASLFFAFIFYKSRSIWPSLSAHLVANFLLSLVGILTLIAG